VNSDTASSHIPLTTLLSLEMIHSSGARTSEYLKHMSEFMEGSSVNYIEMAPKIRLLAAGLGRNQGT